MTVTIDDPLILLAERDPVSAIAAAQAVIESQEDRETAMAYRALGIAKRAMGEIEESIACLRESRAKFEASGDELEAAESDVTLAASIAMSGDMDQALSIVRSAIELDREPVKAHALVQEAGLIARSGDLEGAIVRYEQAEPVLVERNDGRWLALLHSTRGLVRTYLSEFEAAEADITKAQTLFAELNRDRRVAEMTNNLGFLAIQRGDTARGLALLLDAEHALTELRQPVDATLVDRSRGYMLAGLPSLAYETASRAAQSLKRQGRDLETTEALHQAAHAALAAGAYASAAKAASSAATLARDQGRFAWESMANLLAQESAWRAGREASSEDLIGLARDLESNKNYSDAVRGYALGAMILTAEGKTEEATHVLSMARALDRSLVGMVPRLYQSLASARLRRVTGDVESAWSHLREAADEIERNRLTLRATEARSGVTRFAEEIADFGAELASQEGQSAVEWLERFRAASLRITPVVAPSDRELSDNLAVLRGLLRELNETSRHGSDTVELVGSAAELETRIRDLALSHESVARPYPRGRPTVGDLTRSLDGRVMVYLYHADEHLHCEILGAQETQRFSLCESSAIRSLERHIGSTIRRSFLYPESLSAGRAQSLIEELGELTFGSMKLQQSRIVVVPPPDLIALPWNAAANRIDSSLEVVVSPSATGWYTAQHHHSTPSTTAVVGGPDLQHADREARVVAGFHGDPTQLLGDDATAARFVDVLRNHEQLHLVAHTRLRPDNPMFSAIRLSDGDFNLYDLEDVGSTPQRVILSACESATQNVVGGHEMFGIVSILLAAGSREILATVAPIPDSEESIDAVTRIHEGLAGGFSAATALHEAIGDPSGNGIDPSVAFVAYGA